MPFSGPGSTNAAGSWLAVEDRTAHQIFGSPDDLKLRSSMTLFAAALPQQPVFRQVLQRYCGGEPDAHTLALL